MAQPVTFYRELPFERSAGGFDQDAVLPAHPRREFYNLTGAWGRTLTLQARRSGGDWQEVAAVTLANAEHGGAWFETPDYGTTEAVEYRYVVTDPDGTTVTSQTRTLRHVNPADYTGLAARAYELIAPIRPGTIVDVHDGPMAGTRGSDSLALAFAGEDRMLLSSTLDAGQEDERDFRTVVLHELGHLVQRDPYPNNTVMMTELMAVFGPKLPLELSANCLMEHWGGLAEGNHFPYFEGAARDCTLALAAGQPYYAATAAPPG